MLSGKFQSLANSAISVHALNYKKIAIKNKRKLGAAAESLAMSLHPPILVDLRPMALAGWSFICCFIIAFAENIILGWL